MIDRARVQNQLELALNRETSTREIALTRQKQIQDLENNYENVRKQVHDLVVDTARSCVYYQGMGYEQFAIELGLVRPVTPYYVNPNAKGFVPTVRCEYHSNTQGHSTENCGTLKRIIERLIDDKTIVIHNEEAANVTNNPLPAHNNAHVVGMISDDRKYKQMGGMITSLSSSE
ncbi:hypothetical protein HAX54_038621 [Datura stramonium]|uniref:Uncharacterized protein n=1 Tax=Datura stramonium TaxID=4076 RepID=A0ABS8SIA8_DATST|nr:hypothetical protein [Datura stramonium]